MRNYEVVIIDQNELYDRFGEKMEFTDGGFMDINNKTDFWNELELMFNRPVVSIRPGREGWNEVLVFLAKGYIDGNMCILDYEDEDDIESVLIDIFHECENDEYEVFEHYKATCSEEVWKKVDEWVHETW